MALSKKVQRRRRRHQRLRRRVVGTGWRLRLSVFRSNRHIYAQLIDDSTGHTLVSASSCEVSSDSLPDIPTKVSLARRTGLLLAEKATALNIRAAVFDRGGYLFHGRVKGLADGSREGGLVF